MAKAYASAVIEAPVDAVWRVVRDFDGLPNWHPAIARSEIEGGQPADRVGCVRSFYLSDGTHVRERLLSLDDVARRVAYNFETPAFPVENYVACIELTPVTDGDKTFAQWWATFDEAPEDKGKYVAIISDAVFAAGLRALNDAVEAAPPIADDPG